MWLSTTLAITWGGLAEAVTTEQAQRLMDTNFLGPGITCSDAYRSVALMKPAEMPLAQDLIKQLAHGSFCFEYRVAMVHGSR